MQYFMDVVQTTLPQRLLQAEIHRYKGGDNKAPILCIISALLVQVIDLQQQQLPRGSIVYNLGLGPGLFHSSKG